ncbi:MAG: isoprenylcysteine carboxylmethyltransferase family protein [Minwuia sp.]|nr:isoprenylcysteine carboxylmethyltransferase family protein [Minwuia sp.]
MKWLLPPILTLILLIAMVVLSRTVPLVWLMDTATSRLGLFGVGAGVLLILWGAFQFRKVRTNIHTFHDPNVLVTSGPFRFTRNPMYLGFLIILSGAAIANNALIAFLPVAVFFVVANWWYIPYEERAAVQAFGQSYLDYKQEVRRWL